MILTNPNLSQLKVKSEINEFLNQIFQRKIVLISLQTHCIML